MKRLIIHILKRAVKVTLKIIHLVKNWVTVPLYSMSRDTVMYRRGLRFFIATPITEKFSSYSEEKRTMDAIIKSFDEKGISYFIGKHRNGNHSVCVMSEDKASALQALEEDRNLDSFYVIRRRTSRNTGIQKIAYKQFTKDIQETTALTLYRNIILPGGRVVPGEEFRVYLEFWSEADSMPAKELKKAINEAGITDESIVKGSLIAPLNNGIAKVVSEDEQKEAKLEFAGSMYPSLVLFTRKFLTEVAFPIDVVYAWVDGSDENWRKKYEAAMQQLDPHFKNNSMSRYADHEELKYSIRSLEMYAPWVRHIYIVSMDQVPKWFKKNDKITIVNHKDLFKDKTALPVFNSHAIETQLHRIKGLSEHFLYLNDDVFITQPVLPETFFFANGIVKTQNSSALIGTGKPTEHETAPSSAGKNARKILAEDFDGVYITTKYRHTVYPLIKSVSEEITKKHHDIVDKSMRSSFRSPEDVPFTSVLGQSYLQASGKGVQSHFPATTIDISKDESDLAMRLFVKEGTHKTLCLNESDTPPEKEEQVSKRTKRFLENYFPFASEAE